MNRMRIHKNAFIFIIISRWSITQTFGFIIPKALSLHANVPIFANKGAGDYHTNQKMDSLAEQCADYQKPVIPIALKVEEIYNSIPTEEKDLVAFNVLLKAWGRVCNSLVKQKNANIKFGDEISNIKSEISTVRGVVEHLTKQLLEAEAKYEVDPDNSVVIPDETSYNTAIDAWGKSMLLDSTEAAERLLKKMISNPRLEPCTISYNSVLQSHAHSPNLGSLEKMKKIWDFMLKLGADGNNNIKPNISSVNIILQGYKRQIGTFDQQDDKVTIAKEARSIFESVKNNERLGISPDADTYAFMFDIYGLVGSMDAALKSEELMEELKEKYRETQNPLLRPHARTYTSLIGAWSRTFDKSAASRAESIVEEMENIYAKRIASGEPLRAEEKTTKPNQTTYRNWMYTILNAMDDEKARKALDLLRKMREKGKTDPDLKPKIGAYNQAIDACARSRVDQVSALKIAFAVMKTIDIDEDVEANSSTYAIGIKAAENLLPRGAERTKVALAVFEQAKKKGLVNSHVMKHIKQTLDTNEYHDLLKSSGQPNTSIKNVPNAWSKNVYN